MRQIRWIASPPAFIEVVKQRGTGRLMRTGKRCTGMEARRWQHQMDTQERRLPNGWIRDWKWEMPGQLSGGRRHAYDPGPGNEVKRIITADDIFQPEFRHMLGSLFPEIPWHPLGVSIYVWSNLDNFTADVYDDDAPLILFGCYGEFVDVTTHWIKDDPAAFITTNRVGTKPAQTAGAGSTGLVGIRR